MTPTQVKAFLGAARDSRDYALYAMATNAIAAGEHLKVVSERLGNSNVLTTMDMYAHVALLDALVADDVGESIGEEAKPDLR
jgi:integrase